MIPHEPPRGEATGFTAVARRVLRALVALPIQVVAVGRSAAGRAVPSIGASPEELERSWGGPSSVGATLVHWLVAAAVIAVSYAVILFAERHAPEGT